VKAPPLALHAPTFFPTTAKDPPPEGARAFERDAAIRFRAASVDRSRREIRVARAVEIPGTTHTSIGVDEPRSRRAFGNSRTLRIARRVHRRRAGPLSG